MSSGGVLYSVQPTLPEAGGHLGVVLDGRVSGVAPWGPFRWLLLLRGPAHENSCGLAGRRPFRVCIWRSALVARQVRPGKKMPRGCQAMLRFPVGYRREVKDVNG